MIPRYQWTVTHGSNPVNQIVENFPTRVLADARIAELKERDDWLGCVYQLTETCE